MKHQRTLRLARAIAAGMMLLIAVGYNSNAQEVDATGYVRADIYDNITGVDVESGRTSAAYLSGAKDRVEYLAALSFGEPSFGETFGDNYFLHIEGTLTPLVTGDYRFFVRSDDASEFHLNTSGAAIPDPNFEFPVAEEIACCAVFQEPDDPRTSVPYRLTAGTSYGFVFIVKEGTGGDWGQVAWRIEGDATPASELPPIHGIYLRGKADPTGASLSITQDPQDQTVFASERTEFTVGVDASTPFNLPPVYQWRKNGVPIPGASDATLVLPFTSLTDAGTYSVQVFLTGLEVTSQGAVLTVNPDTKPPTVVSASQSDETFTACTIVFSEPVTSPTATTASNYTLDNGATVSAATLSADGRSVDLTTSLLAEGTPYVITINNVQDTAGNTIAADTQITLTTHVFMVGTILHKKYEGFDDNAGGDPNNLLNDPRFGTAPDRVDIMTSWEYPAGGAGRVAADPTRNYFDTLEGYFIPPTTGDYVFLTAGADRWWLYLSTDEDPANKKLIAAEPGGWSDPRGWMQAYSGTLDNRRSDRSTLSTWPEASINLIAGQRYYMLEIHHDPSWCGADDFSATYIMAGAADPANGSAPTIAGTVVGSYVDQTALPPVVTSPTANYAVTLAEGGTETLSVTANGAVSYQWQWNGVDIPGATGTEYVIANAKPTDSGQYWCTAANSVGSVLSPPVHVLVTATGVFSIEGEDFDYDGGQTVPAASVMPYLGGAYDGLSAIHGVDYNSANGAADSPLYRAGDVIAQGTASPMGNEQPGGQFAITRMGEWETTTNFKVGWVDTGDWGNYTRTFPTPTQTYWVFAGSSRDGLGANTIDGDLGLVTAGVGTVDQTVQKLGNFSAPGTGAWSRNSLVALTDDAGGIATVQIGGLNTIRWNYNGGDADYLVFVPASGVEEGPVITEVIRDGNSITVTWTGGGEAEITDDLNGTWQATGDTDGSYTGTIQPGNAFLRIKK